jgi:hypothetical protein
MKDRRQVWLVGLFMVLFAVTRWPGLLPANFSAAYALMFCAGVFFRGGASWWMPLAMMAATDIALNFYYVSRGWDAFQPYQLFNYIVYAGLILLGRRFNPRRSIATLVGGALLGALLFYAITNAAAWLFNPFGNPEYAQKSLATLLIALTKGAGNWPQTWEFFRNTLLSSGLFTALFAAAYKYSANLESAAEKKAAEASASDEEPAEEKQPEEAPA